MSTTFYEIYRLLCQRVGKSDNAVAAEIGLSNSTVTTWKQGALPRRPTLKKVADYFNVSTDYLMGSTLDAQIDVTESKLRNLRAALDFSDENEHGDLEQQLEVLEESYKDLCFAKRLTEKAPTPEGEQDEGPEIRAIQRAAKNMSSGDKKRMLAMLQLAFEEAFKDDENSEES